MNKYKLNIVIIGLSITSSWGNVHTTTYRSLVRELSKRGHRILFLEQDAPWYEANRDMPDPHYCTTVIYKSIEELKDRFTDEIKRSDITMAGSYVYGGVDVGRWIIKNAGGKKAFYDIDTPVTLAKLRNKDYEYIDPELIKRYDIYLSFTGGPILKKIEGLYGSPKARALYCSVDIEDYYPVETEKLWDLGYLGTYSDDRQPPLENLMLDAARKDRKGRYIVAGPQYPESISWPANVYRVKHLPPSEHRGFYNTQRFSMNITRRHMIEAGYSPSVRLFEAAACGTPIISDYWNGLDEIFKIGSEILVSYSAEETLSILKNMPENRRQIIGANARRRILKEHTSAHRAKELESYFYDLLNGKSMQV